MPPRIVSLDHLVLTVADPAVTTKFYTDILGMDHQIFRAADGTERHAMSFGCQKINLHEAGAEFHPHANAPHPGAADLCFLSETPLERWLIHLDEHAVVVESGPVARSGATGPISSIYIRDPDGNLIEISEPA